MTSDRAARAVFADLPWQTRDVVGQWMATGHNLRDSIVNSNALGSGGLITPRDARQEDLQILDRREAAEHEASHLCTAQALGLNVHFARIRADGSGECTFAQSGSSRLERAIVLMAPEI